MMFNVNILKIYEAFAIHFNNVISQIFQTLSDNNKCRNILYKIIKIKFGTNFDHWIYNT